MTVSCHGVLGGRSLPQSKYGLTTTDFGMNGALSLVARPALDRRSGTGTRGSSQLHRAGRPPCRTDRAAACAGCSAALLAAPTGRARGSRTAARARPGQVAVPDERGRPRGSGRASRARRRRTGTARRVRATRRKREVRADAVPRRAERERGARAAPRGWRPPAARPIRAGCTAHVRPGRADPATASSLPGAWTSIRRVPADPGHSGRNPALACRPR